MRVFGIDCGTEITGFGVVDSDEGSRQPRLVLQTFGAIRLLRTKPLPERLAQVFTELTEQMRRWQPEVVAVEEVFYSVNAKSALKLGQVRGVALLAVAEAGVPLAEYSPMEVKISVVGYGRAEKSQVQLMIRSILRLAEPIESEDAADALAIAICHATRDSLNRKLA